MTKGFSLDRKSALLVKIPEASRVLVLDDDPKRLEWLRESVREATGHAPTCCTTVDRLIRELEGGEFEVVFLDHDLYWQDAAYSERKHGNGKEAARYLASMKSYLRRLGPRRSGRLNCNPLLQRRDEM